MEGIILTPIKFPAYCSQISKAIREKRGERLAELLVVEGDIVDQVVAGLIGSSVRPLVFLAALPRIWSSRDFKEGLRLYILLHQRL